MSTRRFISLQPIDVGMTKKEVEAALTSKVIVGYELIDEKTGQYRPIIVTNPYRSETLTKGSEAFIVDYYLAGINQQDDKVTDDELVPLVFRKEKLIGFGWPFLEEKIKKN